MPLPGVDPALAWVVRGALALLLLASAGRKLRAPEAFRSALADYRLLPTRHVGAAAWALVAAELGTGALLLAPVTARAAALAAATLFALYALAIAINLARGRREIDCGCAGPGARRPLGEELVVRNGILVVVALVAALPSGSRTLVWLDLSTIVAGVASLALLYAALDTALAQRSGVLANRSGVIGRGSEARTEGGGLWSTR